MRLDVAERAADYIGRRFYPKVSAAWDRRGVVTLFYGRRVGRTNTYLPIASKTVATISEFLEEVRVIEVLTR